MPARKIFLLINEVNDNLLRGVFHFQYGEQDVKAKAIDFEIDGPAARELGQFINLQVVEVRGGTLTTESTNSTPRGETRFAFTSHFGTWRSDFEKNLRHILAPHVVTEVLDDSKNRNDAISRKLVASATEFPFFGFGKQKFSASSCLDPSTCTSPPCTRELIDGPRQIVT